ncbi:ABC transporter substrate-binding protein [Lacrimispora sp.]|uniref:ABC transporter substrate-binding protein n=1 Tax=Lacrimispora sp. TaxID=2719234 RepID=UPI0032E36E96
MLKKQISRKIVAVSFTILLLLSGCGADRKGGTQADKSDAESADTRVFTTDKGEIEIPVHPQRVITDCGLLGDVLALGVTPVAIEDYTATDVAYKELIKEVKVLEKWEPEYLMAEKPDMIVTLNEENYEQFSKIAPTIYVPVYELETGEMLSFLSDALGLGREKGKEVMDNYKEKVKDAKTRLKDTGLYNKTFSVIRVQGENEIGVRWSNNLGGQILFGALELPQTEAALREVKAGVDWGATLSFEAVPEYMGDYILVTEYGNYQLIENNPVWKSLPAVQKGNIIVLSEPYMYLNDIYSWSAQLDLVTEELLNLAEKNGVPEQ